MLEKFQQLPGKDRVFLDFYILITILGGIGLTYAALTIIQDVTNWVVVYSYAPPRTAHEYILLAVLVVSAALLVTGIVLLYRDRRR